MTAAVFATLAALGAVVRWRLAGRLDRPGGWPIGTLAVNVVGSAALGLLAGSATPVMTAVGTGGLGALTTASGVAAQVADLRGRRPGTASAYLATTVVLSVAAAALGLAVAET
ncbi:MAG: CrcB family protein [Acidimicrobiales bacterium]